MCGKFDVVGVFFWICKLIWEGCNVVVYVGEGVVEWVYGRVCVIGKCFGL